MFVSHQDTGSGSTAEPGWDAGHLLWAVWCGSCLWDCLVPHVLPLTSAKVKEIESNWCHILREKTLIQAKCCFHCCVYFGGSFPQKVFFFPNCILFFYSVQFIQMMHVCYVVFSPGASRQFESGWKA